MRCKVLYRQSRSNRTLKVDWSGSAPSIAWGRLAG